MRKDNGMSSKQIALSLIICVAMAVIYFASAYFFGRQVANIVLMCGLAVGAVVVLVVRYIEAKRR